MEGFSPRFRLRHLFSAKWTVFVIALLALYGVQSAMAAPVLVAKDPSGALITSGNEVTVGTLITVETEDALTPNDTIGLLNYDGIIITAAEHGLTVLSHPVSGKTGSIDANNNIKTDADGHFKVRFLVPASAAGSHTVSAGGRSGTVLVKPRLTSTSPFKVTYGSELTVVGDGFAAGKKVTIAFVDASTGTVYSTDFGTLTADGSGNINGSITVGRAPYANVGSLLSVRATDESGNSAELVGVVAVDPVLVSGPFGDKTVGSSVTVKGHGFPANTTIAATIGGVGASIVAGGSTTDADGSLNGGDGIELQVPNLNYGSRALTVTVGAVLASQADAVKVVPSVQIAPVHGSAGTGINVTGTGFGTTKDGSGNTVGEEVKVSLVQGGAVVAADIASGTASIGSGTAGNVTIPFTIPLLQTPGILTVRVQGAASGAVAEAALFYSRPNQLRELIAVEPNQLSTSSTSVSPKTATYPGETIGVLGLNYNNTSTSVGNLIMRMGGTEVVISNPVAVAGMGSVDGSGAITPNSEGIFGVTFAVPATLTGGTWSIDTTLTTAITVATIAVEPGNLTVDGGTAAVVKNVGDTATVAATGLVAGETVTIHVGSTTVSVKDGSDADADADPGQIEAAITITDQPYGDAPISIVHSAGTLEGGGTKVLIRNKIAAVDGDAGKVGATLDKKLGESVTIKGTGFGQSATVNIWLDLNNNGAADGGEPKLAEATTGTDGTFQVTFSVSNAGLVGSGPFQVLVQDGSVGGGDQIKVAGSLRFIGEDTTPIATFSPSVTVGSTFTLRGSVTTAGKDLGTLKLDGNPIDLDGNGKIEAADNVVEGGAFDSDGTTLVVGSTTYYNLEVSFTVPSLARGIHTVSLAQQTVQFEVTSSAALSDPVATDRRGADAGIQVRIGDKIPVDLHGFGASETVTLTVNDIEAGSVTLVPSDAGTKKGVIAKVPTGLPYGVYKLKASGGGVTVDVTDLHIIPNLIITPVTGTTATSVDLLATAFAANENVTVTFGGVFVTNKVATDKGIVRATINVPSRAYNRSGYQIKLTGNQSLDAAVGAFIIQADIELAEDQPTSVNVGSQIRLRGSGFGDGSGNSETVKITIGGVDPEVTREETSGVTTTATGQVPGSLSSGAFGTPADAADLKVKVPAVPGGIQELKVEGQSSGQTLRINLTVVPSIASVTTAGGGNANVGSELTVSAFGFAADTAIEFRAGGKLLAFKDGAATKTGADGSITTTLIVPALPRGTYALSAVQPGTLNPETGAAFTATKTGAFTVAGKIVSVKGSNLSGDADNPATVSGQVGEAISLVGSGFGAGKSLSVFIGGKGGTAAAATNNVVAADGSVSLTFTVPNLFPGTYVVFVDDDTGSGDALGEAATAAPALVVTPSLTVSPTSGTSGQTQITLSGSGFQQGSVTFTIRQPSAAFGSGTLVGVATVNAGGTIDPALTTTLPPNLASGKNVIDATNGANQASVEIIISDADKGGSLTVSPTNGTVGTEVTLTGTGFAANSQFQVTFDSVAVALTGTNVGTASGSVVTTDQVGSFVVKFSVPQRPGGSRTIAVGGVETSFTVDPKVSADATSGIIADQTITISGNGFDTDAELLLGFNGEWYTPTGTISSTGVPSTAADDIRVAIVGSGAVAGKQVYTSGAPSLRSFKPTADGSFVITFKVPGVPFSGSGYTLTIASTTGAGIAPAIPTTTTIATLNLETKPSPVTLGSGTIRNYSMTRLTTDGFIQKWTNTLGVSDGVLTVSAKGFAASAPVTINIKDGDTIVKQYTTVNADGKTDGTGGIIDDDTSTLTTDASGSVSATLIVSGLTYGTKTIEIVNPANASKETATATVTVLPEIVVYDVGGAEPDANNTGNGTLGTSVSIFGLGFKDDGDEEVTITIGGKALGKASVTADGTFDLTATLPSGDDAIPGGPQLITATGKAGETDSEAFTVNPRLTVDTSSTDVALGGATKVTVPVGGTLLVNGDGFLPNTTVSLQVAIAGTSDLTELSATGNVTDAQGRLVDAQITMPTFTNPEKERFIRAVTVGGSVNSTNNFAAQPKIVSISPKTGTISSVTNRGTTITITGTGFDSSVTDYQIKYGDLVTGQIATISGVSVGTLDTGLNRMAPTDKGAITATFEALDLGTTGLIPIHIVRASSPTTAVASISEFIFSKVSASPTLTVISGATPKPGEEVTVRGVNYPSNTSVGRIWIDGEGSLDSNGLGKFQSPQYPPLSKAGNGLWQVNIGQILTDSNGVFEVSFNVPTGTEDSIRGVQYLGTEREAAANLPSIDIQPTISRNVDVASPGDTITITGAGWKPGDTGAKILLDGVALAASGDAVDGKVKVSDAGTFTVTVTVPDSGATHTTPGNHSLTFNDPRDTIGQVNTDRDSGDKPLQIINTAKAVGDGISPSSGPIGQLVKVTATGFVPGTNVVEVYFDSTAISPVVDHNDSDAVKKASNGKTLVNATSTGEVSFTFNVPNAGAGVHQVRLVQPADVGGAGNAAIDFALNFTVTGEIIVRPTEGTVGSWLSVSGSGFGANAAVTIDFGSALAAKTVTANSAGSFTATFKAPPQPKGSVVVKATSATTSATSTYSIGSTVTMTVNGQSATSAKIGDTIVVQGEGFEANTAYTVVLGNGQSAEVQSNAVGSVSHTFILESTSSHTAYQTKIGDVNGPALTVEPSLTVSPTSGKAGDSIVVRGVGFRKDRKARILIGKNVAGTAITAGNGDNITISDNGEFERTVTIANTVVPGGGNQLQVQYVEDGSIPVTADFTITGSAAGLTLTDNFGTTDDGVGIVGTALEVSPAEATYGANEAVDIFFDGKPLSDFGINIVPQAINGTFTASFSVPAVPGGDKEIRAVGVSTGEERKASFRVLPYVTGITPTTFEFGETVTVTGNGAGSNDRIEIWLAEYAGGKLLESDAAPVTITSTTQTADENGVFTLTFVVPNRLFTSASADVRLKVKSVNAGIESDWLALGVRVVTKGVRLALDKSSGDGDATLTLTGFVTTDTGAVRATENIGPVILRHQFIPNSFRTLSESEITVTTGSKSGNSIITDENGKFAVTFAIGTSEEPIPGGNLNIEVAGGSIIYTIVPRLRVRDAEGTLTGDIALDTDYTVEGVGFVKDEEVTVKFDGTEITKAIADEFGKFSFTLNVASPTVGGPHALTGTGVLSDATATLNVIGSITAPTETVAVVRGDTLEVSGKGFGANEDLTFAIGGTAVEQVENGTTTEDGLFTATITIPPLAAGTHDLTVTSAVSQATLADAVSVTSSIAVNPATANVGTELTITGNGFGADEEVTVAIAGEDPVTATTDAIGSFEVKITLTAEQEHGAAIEVSATSATVTDAVTATFTFDGQAEATNIVVTPTTPAAAGTVITVIADLESGASATFTIEGVAGTADGIAMPHDADREGESPEGFHPVKGTYTVAEGDDVSDAKVTLTVTDALGNVTEAVADTTVTIDTIAPTITEVTTDVDLVRNGGSFTLTVKTDAGATVTADVSAVDTTQTDPITLTETDEAGTYTATVTVSTQNEAKTGDKTIAVTVTDAAGNTTTDDAAVTIRLQAETSFTLSLHAGVNMIHVPVKVEGLNRASDLFDLLGGADDVSLVVMLDENGKFVAFTPNVQPGSKADVAITDQTGAIVIMKNAKQVTFTGPALDATVQLRQGLNLVGVPRSGAVANVSDLKALSDDISVVIREENGKFIAYPTSDAEIVGGQGFIVVSGADVTLTLDGNAWENAASAAPVYAIAYNTKSTPVFVVEGALVREDTGSFVNGLEVTVTNLRTGDTVTDVVGRTTGNGQFVTTFLNLNGVEFGIGDTFELRVSDPSGTFGGVRPIRHTVTSEDVRSGRLDFQSILLSVIPDRTRLLPNYPNPFNPETWIPFQLASDANVVITIYDAAGERVRTLDLGFQPAGTYTTRSKAAYWDGRNDLGERVASGLYFYRIEAGTYSEMRRMVILK